MGPALIIIHISTNCLYDNSKVLRTLNNEIQLNVFVTLKSFHNLIQPNVNMSVSELSTPQLCFFDSFAHNGSLFPVAW